MNNGGSPSIQIETGKLHHPVSLTAKFPVDAELVLACQRMGDKPHRGTPIGKIVELWPYGMMKNVVLSHTKTFIRHMKAQGYEPQQVETEMELWGPYREKVDMGRGDSLVNFEEGNPLIPQGHWGSAARSVDGEGRTPPIQLDRRTVLGHRDWKRGIIFLVRGRFLATHGHRDEENGTIIV